MLEEQKQGPKPDISLESPPGAVYIHIPFCTNKCYYCDFNSFVTRDEQIIWDYLYALDREMEETVRQVPPQKISTIYVGGGTPSYLSPEQMAYFLDSVSRHFPRLERDYEFSMEANPGTTDPAKLNVMKAGGVNRISFGVQTFNDELLKRIGRIHDRRQVYESIENAVNAGFDNISIDLMFGLPGQTLDHLKDAVERAVQLPIRHLSAYSLKVEENTHFYHLYEKGKLPLPSEQEELDMYLWLMDELNARRFKQYEISNFANPGFESRHNITYWLNEFYYGIGAGAHGYVAGRRHVNAGPLNMYLEKVKTEGLPRVEEFAVSERESMEDFMIMGLRMLEGVRFDRFYHRYGQGMREVFAEPLGRLREQGLIVMDTSSVRLSEKGIPLGNEVFAAFLGT
ncbi:MAG: oxygen-independent coproporphyrinogen III oxidase [Bacillaceae bacterium]|nr:oxygen-independent coproporphyrinogen III oxidase [Bacillaceae bacterium]